MRKHIMIALMLFLSFSRVYANEICKEKIVDMGYNYISEDSNYQYDKEDYIVNYGEWQDYNGEEIENIEVKTFYKYNKTSSIRYIHIYETKIGMNDFKISELKVFNKDKEIEFEHECKYCDEDTLIYLDDNNYDFDKQFTLNFLTGRLVIDLLDEYELEDLKINIYLNDNTVEIKKYNIGFSNDKGKKNLLATKFMHHDFKTDKESKLFEHKIDDTWDLNTNYVTEYETDELIENNIFYEKIDEYQKYRLVDIKYKSYLIEKECSEVIKNNEIKVEEKVTTTPNIQFEPIIQNLSINTNNTKNIVETKNDTKNEIKENIITFVGSNTYKEVKNYKTNSNNKAQSKFFIVIYILIIINSVITLILINRKNLSYEK